MITVRCDNPECDWYFKTASPEEWHDKLCPKCNHDRPLINDKDLALLSMLRIAEDVGLLDLGVSRDAGNVRVSTDGDDRIILRGKEKP